MAALALTACGGGSRSSSATSAAQHGSAGAGFTTVIPAGFSDRTAALSAGPVNLLYAAVAPKADGFRSNINVVRESSGGLTDADTVVQRELVGLKSATRAHAFSAIRKLTLDGAPARGVDYLNAPTGPSVLHQYQVFALHGNWIYTVTYTALPSHYAASLPAMRQVLAGWRWT